MAVIKVNIRQVTPRAMPGRKIFDLITESMNGSKKLSLELTRVAPGKEVKPCHCHKAEETAYVVAGTGRVWVDGSYDTLEAGDAVLWPSGSKHCLKNTGEKDLVLVCAFSDPAYQKDYTIFEDIDPFV